MGTLFVQEKDVVAPGQVLADGMDYLPSSGAYREGDTIISTQVGLVNISGRLIKIISLRSKYFPKRGDIVIGKVADMSFSSWFIDIGSPGLAMLNIRDATEFVERGTDLSQFYNFGDLVVAKIGNVTRGAIDLTMRGPGLRKLTVGRIVTVDSSKVPRIIGKQGSMITAIKEKTGCRLIVGQNGIAWIQGTPEHEKIVADIINLISDESHTDGLTEKIVTLLDEKIKTVKPASLPAPGEPQ